MVIRTSSSIRTLDVERSRKVSVPISMSQSLLEDIDRARGDVARSPFVCKILRARLNVKNTGGSNPNAENN
jgi:metal-responsive CopG/Arc/MetJ family transcriptional regulator